MSPASNAGTLRPILPRPRFEPITLTSSDNRLAGISADGAVLALQDQSDVLVCRLSDGATLWRTPVPAGMPRPLINVSLLVSPDGSRLVFNVPNRLIVLDKHADGGADKREILFRGGPGQLRLLRDGKTVLGMQTLTHEVRIWDVTRDRDAIEQPVAVPDAVPPPRPAGGPAKFDPFAPQLQRVASPDGRLTVSGT